MPTTVRLGNNSTDDGPGLWLVELNSSLPDEPFGSETFARVRGDQHPILLPVGIFDLIEPGSTIVSVDLFHWRLNASDEPSDVSVYPLKRNAVPLQATWNNFSTGNAWEGGGATGANDIDPLELVWTFPGDNVANTYHQLASDAGIVAIFQSILDGGGYFGLAYQLAPGDIFDPQVQFAAANNDDGRRPYALIGFEAPSEGVGAAVLLNANQVIQ